MKHLGGEEHCTIAPPLVDLSVCHESGIAFCTHGACPLLPKDRFFTSNHELIQHERAHHPTTPPHTPTRHPSDLPATSPSTSTSTPQELPCAPGPSASPNVDLCHALFSPTNEDPAQPSFWADALQFLASPNNAPPGFVRTGSNTSSADTSTSSPTSSTTSSKPSSSAPPAPTTTTPTGDPPPAASTGFSSTSNNSSSLPLRKPTATENQSNKPSADASFGSARGASATFTPNQHESPAGSTTATVPPATAAETHKRLPTTTTTKVPATAPATLPPSQEWETTTLPL